MTIRYRLLALDLDGTLLNGEKQISAENKLWIRRATEAGVTVIFATGRGMQTAEALWRELDLASPMVFVNGAEVWKAPGELLERTYISREDIRWLHALAGEYGAKFWGYCVESLTGGAHWTSECFERDWMKFGLKSPDPGRALQLRETIRRRGTLEATGSADTNVEISAKGISKLSGVRKVCELLGIGMDQVAAIGDQHNDLELIRHAGLGIAMGNAEAELKQAAGEVTDTNDRDGVAKAIQKFLL